MHVLRVMKAIDSFRADDRGATLVEYLFVAAMVIALASSVIASKKVFESARTLAEDVLTSDVP